MQNKVMNKCVGDVDIFELYGILDDSFALRTDYAVSQTLAKDHGKNVLFNIQELNHVSQMGLALFLKNSKLAKKSALLSKPGPLLERIRLADLEKKLNLFTDRYEAAFFFAKEFAASRKGTNQTERRQFIRLKTVLPLHFWCQDPEGDYREFFAIVTNLSQGGLFAEFIESTCEDKMKQYQSGQFQGALFLELFLSPDEKPLKLTGKVVHGNFSDGGIGVEFFEADGATEAKLTRWLEKHLVTKGFKGLEPKASFRYQKKSYQKSKKAWKKKGGPNR